MSTLRWPRPSAIALLAFVACVASGACGASQSAEVEPRYVAVHNALASMGLVQVGPMQRGSLAQGRETRLGLDLRAECTTIIALGGRGVADLDATLLDSDDRPIAHDTTKDPEAVVRTCVERAGHYTLV